jgi:hypothetical protein
MFKSDRGISVESYESSKKGDWDSFVRQGKGSTFLFLRDYMDYHADRFKDCSLIFHRDNRLVGVLPANISDDNLLASHDGLSYGGLVLRCDSTLRDTIEIFQAFLEFANKFKVKEIIYKRIPRFYGVVPDDEVDYVLFLIDARLFRRDCALVVPQERLIKLRKGRKSEIGKARKAGISLVEEDCLSKFWIEVLEPRLKDRYSVKPVHSLKEISLLKSVFPKNIRQFSAYDGNEILAGVTIYETESVAHAQYSAVTAKGQELGALDYLFSWLIDVQYVDKRYFDFGICNEQAGRRLNFGLLRWKESFGARSYAHDFYRIKSANYKMLDEVLAE